MNTIKRYLLLTSLSLCINGIFTAAKCQYQGTNLRGRILTYNYNQQVPLVSARVDLYFFDATKPIGYQWLLVATTFTDGYGFYFFNLVQCNYYTIQVNQTKNYNIQVIPIDYRYYRYQDLPLFYY